MHLKPRRRLLRLPFDIAAQRRSLLRADLSMGEKVANCGAEVVSVIRNAISGSTAVHLSPVDQSFLFIKEKKIRSAGGIKSPRHLLGFIEKVGEGKIVVFGEGLHVFGTVFGISLDVVGIDSDDRHSGRLEVGCHLGDAIRYMHNVGAMISDKDNKIGCGVWKF